MVTQVVESLVNGFNASRAAARPERPSFHRVRGHSDFPPRSVACHAQKNFRLFAFFQSNDKNISIYPKGEGETHPAMCPCELKAKCTCKARTSLPVSELREGTGTAEWAKVCLQTSVSGSFVSPNHLIQLFVSNPCAHYAFSLLKTHPQLI